MSFIVQSPTGNEASGLLIKHVNGAINLGRHFILYLFIIFFIYIVCNSNAIS